jgi:hypothetical protein
MVTAGLVKIEFGKFLSSHASENIFDFSFLQNHATLSEILAWQSPISIVYAIPG